MDRIAHGSLKVWMIAARPKTLTAAVIPVLSGSALAFHEVGMHLWWITVTALISSLCIQIGTNYVNDAIDFSKGADTHERLGPLRVSQQGLIAPGVLLRGAAVIFAIATLSGFFLVLHGGIPILVIGILSILFGYGYTSGPLPLAYNGLGELFVLIFFGVVAIGGMYFLHTGTYSLGAFVLGIQIGMLATLIIMINNLRDINTDRVAGKRTLAVILGEKDFRHLIEVVAVFPFLLGFCWLIKSPHIALLPLLLIPFATSLVAKVSQTPPSALFNRHLAQAALLHSLFGALLILSLVCR